VEAIASRQEEIGGTDGNIRFRETAKPSGIM